MQTYQLDVVATRGEMQESRHQVHAAVWQARDGLVGVARDPFTVSPWRSCAKPFQVLPLIESGGFDELVWGDEELALACASHGGEPPHVELAAQMLASIGCGPDDLACGPHEPMTRAAAKALRAEGQRPTRLHNNCSGKHAAMLARAHLGGWSTAGYHLLDHPVQRGALQSVAAWSGMPADRIPCAVDGCGVVVFGLALVNMAQAYASLAAAATRGDAGPARIARAIRMHPRLFGGSDRFDTAVVEETSGNVIPKVGAEGVHSVAVLDKGLGLAVKAADGATRAQYAAVLRLLQLVQALPAELPPRLQAYAQVDIRNTRDEVVGSIHCLT